MLPKTADDPHQRKPDIRLAKRELNWEPEVPVQTGLKKTIAYFSKVCADDLPFFYFASYKLLDVGAT